MRKKIYRATIVNDGKSATMLVGGYNKPSVKREVINFYININQIKDFTKFDVYLKQVVYIDGKYIEVE